MRIESNANFLLRFQNKARITIFSIANTDRNKSSSSAFRPALSNLWLLLVCYQKLLFFLFSAFNSLFLCSADHGRNTNFLYTKSFVLYSPANDPRPQIILIPEMTAYKPANDPAGKRGMAWSLFLGISNFRIAVKPLQSSLKSALPSHLSHGDSRKKITCTILFSVFQQFSLNDFSLIFKNIINNWEIEI